MRSGVLESKKKSSLLFDAEGYDPLEWDELYSSIAAALKAEGLPGVYEDPWRIVDDRFLFTGSPGEVERIEEVLEQFAVRIVCS
jgi:hypothetical protein